MECPASANGFFGPSPPCEWTSTAGGGSRGQDAGTAEQQQLLHWLERELDRQLAANPRVDERHLLTVWVRMTPAMTRDLELRYHQRGWGSAQTRTLRNGTYVLELGRD